MKSKYNFFKAATMAVALTMATVNPFNKAEALDMGSVNYSLTAGYDSRSIGDNGVLATDDPVHIAMLGADVPGVGFFDVYVSNYTGLDNLLEVDLEGSFPFDIPKTPIKGEVYLGWYTFPQESTPDDLGQVAVTLKTDAFGVTPFVKARQYLGESAEDGKLYEIGFSKRLENVLHKLNATFGGKVVFDDCYTKDDVSETSFWEASAGVDTELTDIMSVSGNMSYQEPFSGDSECVDSGITVEGRLTYSWDNE